MEGPVIHWADLTAKKREIYEADSPYAEAMYASLNALSDGSRWADVPYYFVEEREAPFHTIPVRVMLPPLLPPPLLPPPLPRDDLQTNL